MLSENSGVNLKKAGNGHNATHWEAPSSARLTLRDSEGLAHIKHLRIDMTIEEDEMDIAPRTSLQKMLVRHADAPCR